MSFLLLSDRKLTASFVSKDNEPEEEQDQQAKLAESQFDGRVGYFVTKKHTIDIVE